ncbi:MAG: PQQ-binding-like beta-propeller repeat protein [Candidatus Bathyarchaeia archaeon]
MSLLNQTMKIRSPFHVGKKGKSISFLLLLAISVVSVSFLPSANAVTVTTYAYLYVGPSPIGVNQPVAVVMWLDKMPPVSEQNAAMTYDNYMLEVTKPDGTHTEMGPYQSDYIASHYIAYLPDMVGKYQFQFKYLGQTIEARFRSGDPFTNNTYLPSQSPVMELTVQSDPIATDISTTPLPTEYWSRPIEEQNRGWGVLGGNWLGVPLQFGVGYDSIGTFNPYSQAPESAHVVWTKLQSFGGVVGGEFGDKSYYTGLSYEERWNPPTVVVINGRLYYHQPLSNWPSAGGLVCVDIRTGEQYWSQDISINLGQLLNFDSMNQHGVIPYLWSTGSTYKMYDAVTGNLVLSMANASTGKITYDDNGNMIVYVLNAGRNWLAMWNSTKVDGLITLTGAETGYQWRPPIGATLNWLTGVQWNVTIPNIPSQTLTILGEDVLVTTKLYTDAPGNPNQLTGYSAHTGEFLWAMNISDYAMVARSNYLFSNIVEDVFTYFDQARMVWYGFDANTGDQIWGPTDPYDNPWGVYSQNYRGGGQPFVQMAYGKFYTTGYDGTVRCYDLHTGENVWNYFSGSSGYETPYGNYPMYGGVTIADGKVYISSNEHSPNSPNWRGGKLYCIDAEEGNLLWSVLGWMPGPVIADGYLVGLNSYDGLIYSFGKGQTSTTVSATQTSILLGSDVLIQGTVTDQSPASKDTPAVADECMSAWMEYLHMQKTKPTDVMGVQVHIILTDPNGNTEDLGTVTSDDLGNYAISWTPPVPGLYKVRATFEGSNSYYSSEAGTAFTVSEVSAVAPIVLPTEPPTTPAVVTTPTPAQSVAPSPSEAPQPPTSGMPTTTYIAIGAAVVVVIAAAAALLLRKRK